MNATRVLKEGEKRKTKNLNVKKRKKALLLDGTINRQNRCEDLSKDNCVRYRFQNYNRKFLARFDKIWRKRERTRDIKKKYRFIIKNNNKNKKIIQEIKGKRDDLRCPDRT